MNVFTRPSGEFFIWQRVGRPSRWDEKRIRQELPLKSINRITDFVASQLNLRSQGYQLDIVSLAEQY